MSTQNISTTAPDNTSLTTFKAWAKTISDWMATIGWTQCNDTGQAVWTATVLTCTQVAMSGTTATISYSSFTGPAPRAGMSVVFTGFANGGNNTTLTLTAVSGGSSGTVTATNASGVNETHSGSGTTTAQAAVPSTSTFIYEIWQSADALSSSFPIFVRFDYGTGSSAAFPKFICSFGTGSNGSGTLTGNFSTPMNYTPNTNSVSTASSIYSGDNSRFMIALFYNHATAQFPIVFGVERSHDSTGADTNTYFHVLGKMSVAGTYTFTQQIIQRPALGGAFVAETKFVSAITSLTSGVVGANIALAPVFPVYGKLDNPSMMIAFSKGGDIVEGATVTVPYFGTNHTMFCTKASGCWTTVPTLNDTGNGTLLRYE
jgi:hypothetical protein